MPALVAQATADAEDLLRQVYGVADISSLSLPVNPVEIAEKLGIEVFRGSFDDGVNGLLRKRPFEAPEIYLNRFEPPARQRFTCAHEIGHYVRRTAEAERAGSDADSWSYIDHRDQLSTRGTSADERYANAFAAALLMPEALVKDRAPRRLRPAGLNAVFGVSAEAMRYRLDNLGL